MPSTNNPLFFGMFANEVCCTCYNKDKEISISDKRSSIITLTAKGKKIYNQIINMIDNDINEILSNVDIPDLEHLNEILNKINWEFELSKNNEKIRYRC